MENITNEVIATEDVMEDVSEVAAKANRFGRVFKVTAGVGIVAVIGGIAYVRVIKPKLTKAKKQSQTDADETAVEAFGDGYVEVDNEDEPTED